jgi:hypothetical protein
VNREISVNEKPLLDARRLDEQLLRTNRNSSAYAALYQQRSALQPQVDKAAPVVRRLEEQRGQITGGIKTLTECAAKSRADLDALIIAAKAP